MRFIDWIRRAVPSLWRRSGGKLRNKVRGTVTGVALLAGCSTPMAPDRPLPGVQPNVPDPRGQPDADPTPATPGSSTTSTLGAAVTLPAPVTKRSWVEVRLQAAQRLVDASPDASYTGTVPDALLAIPVLEVELRADGSVRRIVVIRKPTQAFDTTQLAIAAVHRAAPFGDVSRLPKPWLFTETFLFNDARKFKPRSLD